MSSVSASCPPPPPAPIAHICGIVLFIVLQPESTINVGHQHLDPVPTYNCDIDDNIA